MVTHTYDDANRLTGRTVVPGAGVVGPTIESYALDGLDRVTQAVSGTITTALAYDSASRQLSETTLGKTVGYGYDKVHNRIKTTYPSGHVVDVAIDPLDRPDTVTVAGQPTPAVDYGYRGPHLRQGATYGNGLVQSSTFDGTWRPTRSTTGLPASIHPAFEETLAWSPRSLKTAVGRGDASGRGFVLGHDAAQRVTRAALTGVAAATPNNSVPDLPADPARAFDYAYDLAQNLVARTSENAGAESPYALPTDGSGRNRPASAGGAALGYDANGNRTADDGKQLSFDFRNRLTEVRDAGGALIASYSYDAFNRRVRKDVVGGAVEEMVYAGWQELERYTGGALDQRYTRGAGIDEMVRMEADVDENGSLETAWTPLYDHTGNLAKLTDPTGKVVASYDLSPFGEAFEARSDLVAPEAQLLAVDPAAGSITLNFDHEARLDEAAVLVEDLTPPGQSLAMPGGKSGGILDRSISRPVSDGPVAGRRFEIVLSALPAEGAPMRLTVPAAALVDRFGTPLDEDLVVDFTWPATGAGIVVLDDTAPPEIERIRLDQGHVEITLSEPPASGAASAITISEDPSAQVVAMTWSLQADGHTLRSDSALSDGSYVLDIDSLVPVDLDGKGLAVSFQQALEVPGAGAVQIPFEKPDPTLVPPNAFVNRFAFHGRPVDVETGYVYFRNRLYDPKTGRFISADPMGFVDGPSVYQGFGNSPLNYSDPLGLTKIAIWYGRGSRYGMRQGFDLLSDELVEQAKRMGKNYRVVVVDRHGRESVIAESADYKDTADDYEIYLLSSVSDSSVRILKYLEPEILENDEPLVLIGHSHGAVKHQKLAKRLKKEGREVELFVSVDMQHVPLQITPWTIPTNVRRLLVFQSNPTREQVDRSGSIQPQGRKKFNVDNECTRYVVPPRSLREVHTEMDSHTTVLASILGVVESITMWGPASWSVPQYCVRDP